MTNFFVKNKKWKKVNIYKEKEHLRPKKSEDVFYADYAEKSLHYPGICGRLEKNLSRNRNCTVIKGESYHGSNHSSNHGSNHGST